MTQLLGRALAAKGHEVRVAGIYPMDYPGGYQENDSGVDVWRLRIKEHRLSWIAARYSLYRTVRNWATAGEIDVVDAPDYQGLVAGWPGLDVPVVVRCNGSMTYFAYELDRPVKFSTRMIEKHALQRADYWTAASEHAARITQRVFGLKRGADAILYNPVNVPEVVSEWSSRSSHDVVFTGTLLVKKGVLELAAAWNTIASSFPKAHLHFYGKDSRDKDGISIRSRIEKVLTRGARRQTSFHGHVSREELYEVLERARVAVYPSMSETVGIAPLEAMACGCPTIYTKISVGPEIAGINGAALLVDPRDPTSITEAITRVLKEDSLARDLSIRGQERAESRFSLSTLVDENEAFFQSVIDQG